MVQNKIEFKEEIQPDTPQMREFAAKIRQGIELYGWDAFEEMFVEALNLNLVKQEGGKRYYERADGQIKITIGNFSSDDR